MKGDDRVYLGHMTDLSGKALTLLDGVSRERFDADETLRMATALLIQQIGEAARRVSREFQTAHSELPWAEVIGMRHKIVHDYLDIDYDIVWDVLTVDLPRLLPVLHSMAARRMP